MEMKGGWEVEDFCEVENGRCCIYDERKWIVGPWVGDR